MFVRFFQKGLAGFTVKTRVVAMLMVCMMILTSFVYVQMNHVTVTVDGETVKMFLTFENQKDALLAAAELDVEQEDKVSVSQNEREINVKIKKAFPVTVVMGKKKITLKMTEGTVAQAIKKSGLAADLDAKVVPARAEKVKADMVITISVRTSKTQTEKAVIPYETITRKTNDLYEGEKQVTQKGVNGEKTVTYELIYEDGKQIDKTLSATTITKQPRNEIVSVGTKKKEVVSAAGTLAFKKVINVVATAYSGEISAGRITCLGKVPHWGTVAVDPRVIPLGTKMYIASSDGSVVYGYCTAGDTGGAIKGARVDLWMPTERECNAFGRRPMKVYILN